MEDVSRDWESSVAVAVDGEGSALSVWESWSWKSSRIWWYDLGREEGARILITGRAGIPPPLESEVCPPSAPNPLLRSISPSGVFAPETSWIGDNSRPLLPTGVELRSMAMSKDGGLEEAGVVYCDCQEGKLSMSTSYAGSFGGREKGAEVEDC